MTITCPEPAAPAEATVRHALDRARGGGQTPAVLVLDAGDVGRIDRAYGHATGDEALAELQLRLRAALPSGATHAQLSRERLVAALALDDRRDAPELAQALAAVTRAPLRVADVRVRLDATIGVALAHDGDADPAALLRDADAAARGARVAGAPPWRLADPAEHEHALRNLRLADELADALAQDQLTVYFQPILSLRRDALASVEALVRWQHPVRGLIEPAQFLPIAEESGLIVEIGDWMLRAVCVQLDRWSAQHPERVLPSVALNVSPRELLEQTFASRFAHAVLGAQVPPEGIVLELSDATALDEHPDAEALLNALRRLGVRIVLDRFGGARSSLAQLAQMPIDGLKLDRALLGPAGTPPDELPIAAAIVELGHALGLSITVPGIETERQLAAVRALHADAVQGHLIARPAPATAVADLGELEAGLGGRRRGRAAGEDEDLLPLSAVAAALGVSSSTARRLADQGVLPGTRTGGGHRRFRRGDVQRLA